MSQAHALAHCIPTLQLIIFSHEEYNDPLQIFTSERISLFGVPRGGFHHVDDVTTQLILSARMRLTVVNVHIRIWVRYRLRIKCIIRVGVEGAIPDNL